MVVPSPLAWEPLPSRPRQPWRWAAGAVLVVIAAVIALNTITVPYYGILPGDALPVNGTRGAVTVDSRRAGSGNIYLATVFLQSRITVWDRLTDFLHPENDIVPKQAVTGGETTQQYNRENVQLMNDSQLFAKVAALRRLGYPVPEHGDGAAVIEVGAGTPAAGRLRAGDLITGVDNKPISVSSDVTSAIRAHHPGETVRLHLKRGSSALDLALRTVACGSATCPTDPERAFVGIAVVTDDQSFALPPSVHVAISTNDIGGPSAGLAFTLGLLDALTSRNITGGHRIAATGTINPDGTVGDVGGVKQKTIAVAHQGCQYFIVPRTEAAAAVAAAHGKVGIVPVDNLDQVLTFLRRVGGDLTGIPAVRTPPAE
jgi:Lon-like protease